MFFPWKKNGGNLFFQVLRDIASMQGELVGNLLSKKPVLLEITWNTLNNMYRNPMFSGKENSSSLN
jgi:hypothetical protein